MKTETSQYGFLKFDDNEPDKTTRLSQFIRLALTTDSSVLVRFMKEAWALPIPDLIISITGGAKHFELPARLRKTFQLGIVSVAATTSIFPNVLFFSMKNSLSRCLDPYQRH